MSTQDSAEARCGVPAACDISISLNRSLRATASRSATLISCNRASRPGRAAFESGFMLAREMDHAVDDFARAHPCDSVVDLFQPDAMRDERLRVEHLVLHHAQVL